jgi:hypothetical protein
MSALRRLINLPWRCRLTSLKSASEQAKAKPIATWLHFNCWWSELVAWVPSACSGGSESSGFIGDVRASHAATHIPIWPNLNIWSMWLLCGPVIIWPRRSCALMPLILVKVWGLPKQSRRIVSPKRPARSPFLESLLRASWTSNLRVFWGPRNHLQAWHFVLCLIVLEALETRLAPWHAASTYVMYCTLCY